MDQIVPHSSKAEGNNRPQISPAKHWVFTQNNYTKEDIAEWKMISTGDKVEVLVFQTEVAPSTGTPHLQGCLSFYTKGRPLNLHSSKGINYEKMKGTVQQMRRYCWKEEENKPEDYELFIHGCFKPEPIRTINPDADWMLDILSWVASTPDDRTIHWVWSKQGKLAKTSFAKYLSVHHGAIPVSGKGADMRNAIVEYEKKNGNTPRLLIVPIPRSFNTEYLSYEGLETCKDMYFYSGKFEGGVVVGNPPWVIVMANEPPDLTKCSADRWRVRQIDGDDEWV